MAEKPVLLRSSKKQLAIPAVWLAATLVFFSLTVLLAYDLYQSYQREFASVRRDSGNLSGVLERQFTASGEKIDIVLREAVHEYTPIVTGAASRSVLNANQDLLRREEVVPETQDKSLRVIDAKGRVIFSASDSADLPEINVGDRAYFLKQKNDPAAGLVISEPILSRFTGKWLFTLSRRIDHPDGRFAGIVQTAMRADYFQNAFKSIDTGEHGSIAMFSSDFRLVARYPILDELLGKPFELTEIQTGLDKGQRIGSYQAVSRTDGVTRLYNYRQLETLPLIIALGMAPEDFLKGWKRKAWIYFISWLAFGAALSILIRLAQRRSRVIDKLNDQLAEQVSQAKAASQAKSNFLANMSHEIRTPMNAIIGLTHMLRRDKVTPAQGEKLIRIAGAADHLLSVINDILDLSKIEAGKVELEAENFSPEEMLQRICSIVLLRAQAKGIELVVDAGELPALLNGDVTRLGQALLNYLSNAVKFTEKGSIILRGNVLKETEKDVLVRFEVEDSGIGISPEKLAHLFTAFEQASASISRHYGGTGLGLAISRHIAMLMGGEAGASSTPGKGSIFWLTARLGKAHQEAIPLSTELAGRRALVADDLQITQMVHCHLLRQLGLSPEAVVSGPAAIAAIQKADAENDPFSILLLDLLMPGQGGMDTLAKIQKLSLNRPPICMLVTASGDSSIAISARAAGFADVLVKPINQSILKAALAPHFSMSPLPVSQKEVLPEQILSREYAGAKILLVEDEPVNQAIAKEFLQGAGLNVTLANNGRKALELAESRAFDLILMDMQMPVMDGLQATRQIRALPGYSEVPIIAMTANAFTEDRTKCLLAGMNDFICKPVEPEVFFSMLLKWLTSIKA
uniref:Virulence sensor protein BvgS n=1 Tax=Dechloromonas aromatica (strain RCB) TaxID=159087 RepID=Q47C10_DECAR